MRKMSKRQKFEDWLENLDDKMETVMEAIDEFIIKAFFAMLIILLTSVMPLSAYALYVEGCLPLAIPVGLIGLYVIFRVAYEFIIRRILIWFEEEKEMREGKITIVGREPIFSKKK